MKNVVVKSTPTIKPETDGSFSVTLVLTDGFDYEFPFRGLLGDLVEALGLSGKEAKVELPAPFEDEDFIDGRIIWGDSVIQVYFEYSLGYIYFQAQNREQLEHLLNICLGHRWQHDV